MSAVLRHDENKEDFIKLFIVIVTYRKSIHMLEFLLIILVGM